MNKRLFLSAALALPIAACAPAATQAAAPQFQPTRFTATVQGSGSDVLLIPGLASPRTVWSGTVAGLPGYRYHLLQVNGFAGTPPGANVQGEVLAPLVDEIARYIRANRLRRPAIVGHSMGGTLAMMLAARHPDLAGKVMVVDMLPQAAGLFGSSSAEVAGLAATLRAFAGTENGRALVSSFITAFGPPGSNASRSDPDLIARATHELAVTDVGAELARIRVPATIVYAAPDAAARAAVETRYRSAYAPLKGAELVRIDGAGHMIMYDRPAAFRAALMEFLAS